jgi:antitoxin (DNA-binding transcriptional repressor) of toxin-antitoxin stability system
MATFHFSEAEAASNFADLMAKVRAGGEVIIESDSQPVAILRAPGLPRARTLSESLALAEARIKERGYELTLDPDFAADMDEIVRNRKAREPRDMSAWD